MRNKMFFASGFALGYVLGARAGRERYEQIARAARSLASNPQVQQTTTTLTHQASDVLGSAVQMAADVSGRVGSKVVDRFPGRFGVHPSDQEEPYAGQAVGQTPGQTPGETTPSQTAGGTEGRPDGRSAAPTSDAW
jgi:hypothetical protein